MLAEETLPNQLGVPGKVIMVGAQTGHALDDVGAHTDADAYALFQVKAGLGLGAAEDSPLARAIGQALEQYTLRPVPFGGQGPQRVVEPGRDALVICTDKSAPASIRTDLKSAVRRAANQPAGTPFTHELNAGEHTAIEVLLTHIRRIWVALVQAEPSDEEIRTFLRLLRIFTVDAESAEPEFSSSVTTLERVVPAGSGPAAWRVLVDQGHEAAEQKLWLRRDDIVVALQNGGLPTEPLVAYRADIERLRRRSQLNADALARSTRLPSGTHIERRISEHLNSAVDAGPVVLVGEAGAGKTGVAADLAQVRAQHQDVVLLQGADVIGPDHVVLTHSMPEVFHAWSGPPAVLVLDGLDAVRGSENRGALIRLVERLGSTRWTVLATVRTFDAHHDKTLQRAFAGTPVSDQEGETDPRLSGIRHLLVGNLTDDELEAALAGSHALAELVSAASVDIRALLRNPFNLELADSLVQMNPADPERLGSVRSRLGLLQLYWQWRVQAEDRTARDAVLGNLCRHMLLARDLRAVEQAPTVTATHSATVEALLRDGVLTVDPGIVSGARRVLAFRHNILFDFAAAMYVLIDPLHPGHLLAELDRDPELPLVARPSLNLLVDHLWEHRAAGAFWDLCLDVAASDHLLASLAFAGRLLALARHADELNPLTEALSTPQNDARFTAASTLTNQMAGALGSAAVLADDDLAGAIEPVAVLVLQLAQQARTTSRFDQAALAADLLRALQRRTPLAADAKGALTRARAVSALLDACRSAPDILERVAGSVYRHLAAAIDVDADVAEAVERAVTDNNAITQWGGTVLHLLAQAVPALLRRDRTLAIEVCNLVWNFEDQRDEQVTFGGGPLLPMRESRSQQANHGRYVLATVFDEMCSADVLGAAVIFCDIANSGIRSPFPSGIDPTPDWPLNAGSAVGWLQFGDDLDHLGGSGASAKMANSLGAYISANVGGQPSVAAVVEALVARLHNTAGWSALIQPSNDAVSLGRALLPALSSGSLLAHPETHESAARLLAALGHGDSSIAPAALEAAIRNARTLADAHGMSERLVDELLGCLDPQTVTDPAFRARLDQLATAGGPPAISARMEIRDYRVDSSLVSDLREDGLQLSAAEESAVRDLDAEYTRAISAQQGQPHQELPDSALQDALVAASGVLAAMPNPDPRVKNLQLQSARVLAADAQALPGTAVGERIVQILFGAANDPHEGHFLQ
jgi:hypothetical protein